AFCRNAVDPRMPPRRREPRRIACRIVVMHEAEIELRLGMQPQSFERREIRIARAVFRYRHVEVVDRALDAGADRVGHLDHYAHVLRLHEMLIGRTAVTEMIAELDRT